MSTTIKNPGIPSSNLIPEGIFPGRIVKVKGATTLASKRFSVNLQCGPKMYPGEDIAFHFNPRFDTNILVRNHYAGSKWGSEEISSGVPMNKGECFEILIYCYNNRFKVEVNGKCVCEFNHHIPFGRITHIMVEGDVTIDEVSFVGAHLPQDLNLGIPSSNPIPGGMFPGRIVKVKGGTTLASKNVGEPRFDTNGPGHIYCYYYRFKVEVNGKFVCEFNHHIPFGKITHIMVEGDVTMDEISYAGANPPQDPNLKVPFVVPILGCMQPDRVIRVKGTTPTGGERFAINLQCGPKLYPDEDIAFSFSPRFNQGTIVLNHFGCSKWGHEVTQAPSPLSSGSPFEFYIYCYENSFKVLLNEQQVCEFSHRIPIQRITHVMVDGDAMIFELDYDSPEHPCGPPPSSGSGEISGPY
ncbi:galectin-4-like [Spodoptera litura]|uniref:Galectin n=1 Tax=Spodoptera litura TaxID=69820 RepID=A0A9J7IMY2_SPOLT|nr:galectin-4-like [Spodoptera litura]